jgi:hypothetical protein
MFSKITRGSKNVLKIKKEKLYLKEKVPSMKNKNI